MEWTVKDVLIEEYGDYLENESEENWVVIIYENNNRIASEYVTECLDTMTEYFDMPVKEVEYCSDNTNIYIQSICHK